ncbi:flavin reductase family protein [Amorphus sp. 3PC139-8]|uniref:flavin reductase family protein n=1 Tax=Amorphus sp. 3PC139-8 TaxID=2735676 RepID=UPI00345CB090
MSATDTRLDPVDLRRACGQFATGVAVVATRSGGRPIGMTINSFASVSLEPPLVLWSLRNSAHSRTAFARADGFSISILAAPQIDLARRFAGSHDDPFEGVAIETSSGLPLISGALAHLVCETRRIHDGGDHQILVGEVTDLAVFGGEPLVFVAGRFATGLSHLEPVGAK